MAYKNVTHLQNNDETTSGNVVFSRRKIFCVNKMTLRCQHIYFEIPASEDTNVSNTFPLSPRRITVCFPFIAQSTFEWFIFMHVIISPPPGHIALAVKSSDYNFPALGLSNIIIVVVILRLQQLLLFAYSRPAFYCATSWTKYFHNLG